MRKSSILVVLLIALIGMSCTSLQEYGPVVPEVGSKAWITQQHAKNLAKKAAQYQQWMAYKNGQPGYAKSYENAGEEYVITSPYIQGTEMVYGTKEYRAWNVIEYNAYKAAYDRNMDGLAHAWDGPAKQAMYKNIGKEITWQEWAAGKRPKASSTFWTKPNNQPGYIYSCGSWGCQKVIHCTSYGCKGLK